MMIKTKSGARLVSAVAVLGALAIAAPLAQASPGAPHACAAGSLTVRTSPSAGWITVTDAQGVPWLEPAELSPAVSNECADTVADPVQGTSHSDPVSSVTSPYAGWTVVVDDQGVPWLVPSALTR